LKGTGGRPQSPFDPAAGGGALACVGRHIRPCGLPCRHHGQCREPVRLHAELRRDLGDEGEVSGISARDAALRRKRPRIGDRSTMSPRAAAGLSIVPRPGDRAMSTTPRPPRIIPYLVCRDVPAALDFPTRAFGFKEEMRHEAPSGGMRAEASVPGRVEGAADRRLRNPSGATPPAEEGPVCREANRGATRTGGSVSVGLFRPRRRSSATIPISGRPRPWSPRSRRP
jgi:hypothetical protein